MGRGKRLSILCMAVGVLLIAAAVFLALCNAREDSRAGESAESVMQIIHRELGEGSAPEETDPPGDGEDGGMTVKMIGGYGYIGYLSFPSLELELPVMSEWDYTRLAVAPCLYYGSVKTDNMVIAGHNYTRHFGSLTHLGPGDSVIFTDMDGRAYTYEVGDIEKLPPEATGEMIAGKWSLSLYTCTYAGDARLTIRCQRTDGKP